MGTPGRIVLSSSGKRGVLAGGKVSTFSSVGTCADCCSTPPCTLGCYWAWLQTASFSSCTISQSLVFVAMAESVPALGTQVVDGVAVDFTDGTYLNVWRQIYDNTDPPGSNIVGCYNTTGTATVTKKIFLVRVASPDCVSCVNVPFPDPFEEVSGSFTYATTGDCDVNIMSFAYPIHNSSGCKVISGILNTYVPVPAVNDFTRYLLFGVGLRHPTYPFGQLNLYGIQQVDTGGNPTGPIDGQVLTANPSLYGCATDIGFTKTADDSNECVIGYADQSFFGSAGSSARWRLLLSAQCDGYEGVRAYYGF